jgi:hypothetical protein
MSNYAGPFTLVDDNGSEYEVEGSFRAEGSPGGLRSWSGTFTSGPDVGNLAGARLTLRLPDGGEGAVLVSNLSFGSGGGGMRGEFAGTGPAPGE